MNRVIVKSGRHLPENWPAQMRWIGSMNSPPGVICTSCLADVNVKAFCPSSDGRCDVQLCANSHYGPTVGEDSDSIDDAAARQYSMINWKVGWWGDVPVTTQEASLGISDVGLAIAEPTPSPNTWLSTETTVHSDSRFGSRNCLTHPERNLVKAKNHIRRARFH